MSKRLEVHERLKKICDNVYYQTGDEKLTLSFPCIIYHQKPPNTINSNNKPYIRQDSYDVTFISRRESDDYMKLYDHFHFVDVKQFFISDGLYHKVVNIKY